MFLLSHFSSLLLSLFLLPSLIASYTLTNVDATDYNLITVNGVARAFYAFVPTSLRTPAADASPMNPTLVPLVVGLHGSGSSGSSFSGYCGFPDVSESTSEFIFVAPSGTCGTDGPTGSACDFDGREPSNRESIDFLQSFLRILLISVNSLVSTNAHLYLDANNIFLVGHSQGAYLSYAYPQLARPSAPRIRTIAPYAGHAGTWFTNDVAYVAPHPSQRSNVLVAFGEDNVQVQMDPDLSNSLVLWFADVLGCGNTIVPNFASLGLVGGAAQFDCSGAFVRKTYEVSSSTCDDSYVVRSIVIANLDHVWPGGYSPPQDVCPSGTRVSFLVGHTTWAEVVWDQLGIIGFGTPYDPAQAARIAAARATGAVLGVFATIGIIAVVAGVVAAVVVLSRRARRLGSGGGGSGGSNVAVAVDDTVLTKTEEGDYECGEEDEGGEEDEEEESSSFEGEDADV